jgi:hypothetical protein
LLAKHEEERIRKLKEEITRLRRREPRDSNPNLDTLLRGFEDQQARELEEIVNRAPISKPRRPRRR